MVAGGGGFGTIPAGFTYLGQFVDHDLTFDKTSVMFGDNVAPAQLLQARSPSLDLDSLYGAGPTDPGVAEVLRGGRDPPEGRHHRAGGRHRRQGGPRPAARRGLHERRQAQGDHPRPAERREPRGRADALRDDPLPQPRRRHAARVGAREPEVRQGARARHQALPVDAAHRLPAADLRGRRRQQRLQPAAQGVRGRRDADRRADDADRVLRRRVPARPLDDPRRLQLEQDLRRRRRHARLPVRVHGAQRRPLRRPRLPSNWIADFRRLYDFSETNKPDLVVAAEQVQPRDADRHAARRPAAAPAAGIVGGPTGRTTRTEPRLPQPHAGADGAARHRPADGDVPQEQGRQR